jgi:hypothetical protein
MCIHTMLILLVSLWNTFPVIGADDKPHDAGDRENAARRYLAVKYDDVDVDADGSRVVYGLAYDPRQPLEWVHIEELRDFLPDSTFIRTALQTPYHEFPHCEVIVAITKNGENYEVRSCPSPVFRNPPSRKFLGLARGKVVPTPDHAKRLISGMGKLLAAVTHQGSVTKAESAQQHVTLQVLHDRKCWLELTLQIDREGRVQNLVVEACAVNAAP